MRVPGNGNDRRALEMLELVRSLSYITCLLAIAPRAAIKPSPRRSRLGRLLQQTN